MALAPRDGLLKRGVALTGVSATALLSTALFDVPPILVWNATPSVPLGLYAVLPIGTPKLGDLVLVEPPTELAGYLSKRGYLPDGTPILKRVAALSRQRVCRTGRAIHIDDVVRAIADERDNRERSLPTWSGCHRLRSDEVFFLNGAPNSLDGRYFGTLKIDVIGGRAVPLWTFDRR